MAGSDCDAIISDQSPAIISGIEKLKTENRYSGVHLFDYYHLVKNIKSESAQTS